MAGVELVLPGDETAGAADGARGSLGVIERVIAWTL